MARPRWSARRWPSTASTRSGGISGRPIELLVADYESKPDVGRRKAEKLLVEDNIDAHQGGFLSNVCLACMPVFAENKVVNMIGVCLDTTITTSKCDRYTFRPFDYAPSQAVGFAPYLISKVGKRWHIAYADYAWGQSTKDAYAEQIKKAGGEVVGTTGIPLGTADMTPFLSKITGNFDGLFGIFFGKDGVTIGNQAFDLGLTKKYKWVGDGAIAEFDQPAGAGQQDRGLRRHQPLHSGARGPLNTPAHKKFFDEAVGAARSRSTRPGPLPDRYVQSNYEAMNALKLGMEKSGFQGREDTDEADRGAGRPGDEGRRRLPAGRQGAAQGRPPGLPPPVHLRDQGRQAQDHRGGPAKEKTDLSRPPARSPK